MKLPIRVILNLPFDCGGTVPLPTELERFPSFALAKFAASLLTGCTGAGAAVVMGVRRMFNRHVGQVCCRWNHDRKHVVWKMCPQGSFFELLTISSRQMMQMLSDSWSSSGVASGYRVFMLRIARRDRMTSFKAFLKFLQLINRKGVRHLCES